MKVLRSPASPPIDSVRGATPGEPGALCHVHDGQPPTWVPGELRSRGGGRVFTPDPRRAPAPIRGRLLYGVGRPGRDEVFVTGLNGAGTDWKAVKKRVDDWEDAGTPGEDRVGAARALRKVINLEKQKPSGGYKLHVGNFNVTEFPWDIIDQLEHCFELSLQNNRLESIELNSPSVGRILARNNELTQVRLGKRMQNLRCVDLLNNRLTTTPEGLDALNVEEVLLADNPVTARAVSSSTAPPPSWLQAGRPLQTDQSLKALSRAQVRDLWRRTSGPEERCQLLGNLLHSQRRWLMRESEEAVAIQEWLGLGGSPPAQPAPAPAPAQALAWYVGALAGGLDPSLVDERVAALAVLDVRIDALRDRAANGEETLQEQMRALVTLIREAGALTGEADQAAALEVMFRHDMGTEGNVVLLDELRHFSRPRHPEVREKIAKRLGARTGNDPAVMHTMHQIKVMMKGHDERTVESLYRTFFARCMSYELTQREIEKQLRTIWNEGDGLAAWLTMWHVKQSFLTHYEAASILASGDGGPELKIESGSLFGVAADEASLVDGLRTCADLLVKAGAAVATATPVVSAASGLVKKGLDHHASVKEIKDGDRTLKTFEHTGRTYEYFADAIARGLALLMKEDIAEMQEEADIRAGDKKGKWRELIDMGRLRIRRMTGSRPDPKETDFECGVRKKADDYVSEILEALHKGEIKTPPAQDLTPFGRDEGLFKEALRWFGRKHGVDDRQIERVVEATAWGTRDAGPTRGQLKEQVRLEIYGGPGSSHGSLHLPMPTGGVTIDKVNLMLKGLENTLRNKVNTDIGKTNKDVAEVRGKGTATKAVVDTLARSVNDDLVPWKKRAGQWGARTDGRLSGVVKDQKEQKTTLGNVQGELGELAADVEKIFNAQTAALSNATSKATRDEVTALGVHLDAELDQVHTMLRGQADQIEAVQSDTQTKANLQVTNHIQRQIWDAAIGAADTHIQLQGVAAKVQDKASLHITNHLQLQAWEAMANEAETRAQLQDVKAKVQDKANRQVTNYLQRQLWDAAARETQAAVRETAYRAEIGGLRTQLATLTEANAALRAELATERIHRQRSDILHDLTPLTTQQTTKALRSYLAQLHRDGQRMSQVQFDETGQVLAIRPGTLSLSAPLLPDVLIGNKHPRECYWSELKELLAEYRLPVKSRTLQQAVFAATRLSAPRP